MLTGSELAARLDVSKGRVSQWKSEGKLEGCYTGEGRSLRYDLEKACAALGRRLDQGQMIGNGAATRRALAQVQLTDSRPVASGKPPQARSQQDGRLRDDDDDAYQLARTQQAQEQARRLRMQNQQAEGIFVLASETERQVARLMAQEVAEFEAVLRGAAREVADRLGVDSRKVRQILTDAWRSHRATRTSQLQAQADGATMTDAEIEADV